MQRFFTPFLKQFYLVLAVALGFYCGLVGYRQSSWNKERLYRKLVSSEGQAAVAAAVDLAMVGGQDQLVRALKLPEPATRALARQALWLLWYHAAGDRAFAVLQQAEHDVASGRLNRAEALLNRVVKEYPRFAEGWNRRATFYWQTGQYKKSIADCRRVLTLNPQHFGAWEGMALCQIHLGRIRDACTALQAALQICPHDTKLQQHLRMCERWLKPTPDTAVRPGDFI